MSIYVEILICSGMDDLWEKTQDPKLHQRWDLRFSEIDYLPRQPGQAQKFLYKTRIGGGLRIEGAGESTGKRDDASGQRTSALKFCSDDPKSLIKLGSGYWKYIPGSRGIRFITWYDYKTRFGIIGQIADRVFFRPLLGWATAWSFDRLRLWLEKGILPEVSRYRAFVYALSRLMIAFVWLYHGLIPKLIYRNTDELSLLRDAGIPNSHLSAAMTSLGIIEVCFALAFVIFWKSRWPLWLTIIGMISALLTVGIASPSFFSAAFNPVTLNLSVAVLALIGLLSGTGLPSASNCRRKPSEAES
jgi:uncharacterized membrane protein YphA (DoxX/SURF4 family)